MNDAGFITEPQKAPDEVWSLPTPSLTAVRLGEIIFDAVIYPRAEDHDPALVQKYVDVLPEIEAAQQYISVSQDNKLLDGKHRWLAYRKKYQNEDPELNQNPELQVLRYPVTAAHDQLRIAAKLNNSHGAQLTLSSKEKVAKSLYAYGSNFNDIAATLFRWHQTGIRMAFSDRQGSEGAAEPEDVRPLARLPNPGRDRQGGWCCYRNGERFLQFVIRRTN